jgi:hypothetical protein
MSPRLPRPSIDGVLNLVDVDKVLEHVDLNRQLERIDINALLERIDMDKLLDRLDVNRIIEKVNVEDLVERTDIGALIADSTSSVTERVLDSLRARAVAMDDFCNRTVNRVLRRKPEDIEVAPAGVRP